MNKLIICLILSFLDVKGYSQNKVIENLYYCQDSISFSQCGNITAVDVFIFSKDSISNKTKNLYVLAIKCPEFFDAANFKKGKLYRLWLNKKYSTVKQFMSPGLFKSCSKKKNFFVVEKISPYPFNEIFPK